MYDQKLVINKNDISNDVKEKLRNCELSYDELKRTCNNLYTHEFKNKKEKEDYYIIQNSFLIRNKYEQEIFICNREPVGFDDDERITSGMSLLFSFSKVYEEQSIENKILNHMIFRDHKDNKLTNIEIEISELGIGYREMENNGPIYIFYVYEVNLLNKVYDIFYTKSKDIDYIFKINDTFLNYTYDSFMNKNAKFDIALLKNGFTNDSTYDGVVYRAIKKQNISKISKKLTFNEDNIKTKEEAIKNFLIDMGISIANITTDEIVIDAIDIARCLFKVPLATFKISSAMITS